MTEHWVLGLHAVAALMKHPKRRIHSVYMTETRQDQKMQALIETLRTGSIPIKLLSSAEMNAKFPDMVHQGIVAVSDPLPLYQEQDIASIINDSPLPLILILDGVTDPHNLGACLRSADGAGVDCVIIPKDKSASLGPVVSKVASGAAETIPLIRVTNLARCIESLKQLGIWVYGAAGEASESIYQLDALRPLAIVLGAEGEGLRRLTRERCDGLFAIPMHGSVPSLNVSVAAGVSLFEMKRQRIMG